MLSNDLAFDVKRALNLNEEIASIQLSPKQILDLLDDAFPVMERSSERFCIAAKLYLYLVKNTWMECFPATTIEVLKDPIRRWTRVIELFPGSHDPDVLTGYFYLAQLYHLSGEQELCLSYIKRAHALQEEIASNHPLKNLPVRFFPERAETVNNIGHIFNDIEFTLKSIELGWLPFFHPILFTPLERVANKAALEYWRPRVLQLTDKKLMARLSQTREALSFDNFWLSVPGKGPQYSWTGVCSVQKKWEDDNRSSFLKLNFWHKERGWQLLEALGIPRGSWFVSLHVRDQSLGKDGKIAPSGPTAHRDATFENYIPAIEAITQRGGWVLRLGSRSMRPLPPMHRVIDYAYSDVKSDWMDLFTVAESRFFLGSASGLNGVAIAFNVPSLLTNVSPMNGYSTCRHDLYLPKLLKSKTSGRYLSFKEALSKPFDFCFNSDVYQQAGVDVVENSPEEIEQATIEMIYRLEQCYRATSEEERLQRAFKELATAHPPYLCNCNVSQHFLNLHQDLLSGSFR